MCSNSYLELVLTIWITTGLYYSDTTETIWRFNASLIISTEHQNIWDKSVPKAEGSAAREGDSPRRKLHSTVVGRVMLSHDASLRKSEAASSRVAFSTSMNWRRREGHTISHLQAALRHCKLGTQRWGWQCKLSACVRIYLCVRGCPVCKPMRQCCTWNANQHVENRHQTQWKQDEKQQFHQLTA